MEETRTEVVLFETIREDNNEIPEGEERTIQEGVNGEKLSLKK